MGVRCRIPDPHDPLHCRTSKEDQTDEQADTNKSDTTGAGSTAPTKAATGTETSETVGEQKETMEQQAIAQRHHNLQFDCLRRSIYHEMMAGSLLRRHRVVMLLFVLSGSSVVLGLIPEKVQPVVIGLAVIAGLLDLVQGYAIESGEHSGAMAQVLDVLAESRVEHPSPEQLNVWERRYDEIYKNAPGPHLFGVDAIAHNRACNSIGITDKAEYTTVGWLTRKLMYWFPFEDSDFSNPKLADRDAQKSGNHVTT